MRPQSMPLIHLSIALLALLVCSSHSANIYYNTSMDTICANAACNFNDATIWNGGVAPSTNDDAHIIANQPITIELLANQTAFVQYIEASNVNFNIYGNLSAYWRMGDPTQNGKNCGSFCQPCTLQVYGVLLAGYIGFDNGTLTVPFGGSVTGAVQVHQLMVGGSLGAVDVTVDSLQIMDDAVLYMGAGSISVSNSANFSNLANALNAKRLFLMMGAQATFNNCTTHFENMNLDDGAVVSFTSNSAAIVDFFDPMSFGTCSVTNSFLQIGGGLVPHLLLGDSAVINFSGQSASVENLVQLPLTNQPKITVSVGVSLTSASIDAIVWLNSTGSLDIWGNAYFGPNSLLSGNGTVTIDYGNFTMLGPMSIFALILQGGRVTASVPIVVPKVVVNNPSTVDASLYVTESITMQEVNLTITGDYQQTNNTAFTTTSTYPKRTGVLSVGGHISIGGSVTPYVITTESLAPLKILVAQSKSGNITGQFASVENMLNKKYYDKVSVEISGGDIYVVYDRSTRERVIKDVVGSWKWSVPAILGFVIAALIVIVIVKRYRRKQNDYIAL